MKTRLALALPLLAIAVWSIALAQSPIRQIDFRNFSYAWNGPQNHASDNWRWLDSPPQSKIKVSDGTHHFNDENATEQEPSPFLTVRAVTYGDLIGDGSEEAIVKLNYSTGGTANWDYLYVYKLANGHPILLGRLESGSRGYGGLIKVSVRDRLLVTDFADKEKLQGECCSAGYIRVQYRWQRGTFVEFGTRQHGDMELHEGPKGMYKWEEASKD
jgi:hypothetical protein